MFHTLLTLAYIIPNIYVFIRILILFINREYRRHFTIAYSLLALIYPVSNLFSEDDHGLIANAFITMGDYILPFYLYLFLSVLVFDIFLLFNLFLKIVPSSKLMNAGFRIKILSFIVILSLVVEIGGIINFNTIRTSEYYIEISDSSTNLDKLKVAFVADFHLSEGTNVKFVERFVEKISKIKPDLMLFGGDIVEGDGKDENLFDFEHLLMKIKAEYGKFAVLGNHEHYAGQADGDFLRNSGIVVLRDSVIVIDSSFYLAGRNDSHIRTRNEIDELLSPIHDSLPVIVIDHRPPEMARVSKTSADIQLSGHSHNGQMFPINLITRKIYELSWGYRKMGNTHFFVTSGIRLWGPLVRTIGKSEIMVINITFHR